ncbi:hypothetical protein EAH68_11515 [Corynebacterium hylobatis]|uniref:Uncharacterized protein n=1 Tax=Corynebacterium hylobatis TaxID=1859290 RepID=A0A3R9ZD80_9CORY|nr:hypothetical protein [Corynebacterium hylobatis]RSZ61704.1 hypothetical protein EAH68_11515 [Corynebacterium hylobatis]
MTTFRNRSSAGDSDQGSGGSRVSAAAVWEPSGFNEGSAAERHVRTLRPWPRTQGRETANGMEVWGNDHAEQGTGPRETGLTYLLGALLGLAVASACLVGTGEEDAPASPTVAERPVVPQNG